jgi:hypothetical protein
LVQRWEVFTFPTLDTARSLPNFATTTGENKLPLTLLIVLILFLIIPIWLVWRLTRVPLRRGNLQVQLLWRGFVAGVTGGLIGATLSSLIFGIGAYAAFAYLYWLVITPILGMVLAFLMGAIQKSGLNLNLLSRVIIGAVSGAAIAWVWASAIRTDYGGPMNRGSKGVITMIVCCGVVSGILGGPLKKEA